MALGWTNKALAQTYHRIQDSPGMRRSHPQTTNQSIQTSPRVGVKAEPDTGQSVCEADGQVQHHQHQTQDGPKPYSIQDDLGVGAARRQRKQHQYQHRTVRLFRLTNDRCDYVINDGQVWGRGRPHRELGINSVRCLPSRLAHVRR
jgi:hypothetical protein